MTESTDQASAVSRPSIAHVPMALATQGSTLMTVARRLAEAYRSMGGESSIVLSHNRGLSAPGLECQYVDYTVKCPREWFTRRELALDVVAGQLGLERPFYGKMYDPAIRELKQISPDVVLLYEGHYASATLPRWRELRMNSEVCLYVHNPVSRTYGARELRRLLGSADRVIFCADHLKRSVQSRLGRTRLTNLETVHNGVDPRFVASAPRRAESGEFGIIFFGRVAQNKGVHLVLQAVAEAAGRTKREMRVRIVGSAQYSADQALDPYEVSLRQLASDMNVPVEFIPFVPPEELLMLLRESSVACLPSTWAEGFPLAALEAMATGLPVICSDSPGMMEACGDAAIVMPKGDVSALARAIVAIADDAGYWESMSSAGWSRARQFTWQDAVRQIARVS